MNGFGSASAFLRSRLQNASVPFSPDTEVGRCQEIKTANGTVGFICRSAVDGSHFFRVYGVDGSFVDYAILHDDLEVTISTDAMASFYRIGGEHFLDHSPEVLGLHQSEKDHK
jgi:hypothetical protein